MVRSLFLLNTIGSALAGTILWDGRAPTAADLTAWSWSNAVGAYQNYIHGTSDLTSYVNLDTTYQNPADTGSSTGIKITLDSTAYWNGQTMRRTELIPQTSAAIGAGQVFYHFSMMRSDVNAPSESREHQIAFFESHFTEMKSGWQSGATGTSDPLLRWDVTGSTEWNTTWEAGVWHNIAYGIDFSAGTVAFYHSTGADDLVLTVPAVACSASSNGADFHVGVLELPRDGYADTDEDIYFSGVYVESGDITTSVAGPGGVAADPVVSSSVAPVASSVASSTQAAVVTATSVVVVVPVAVSSSAPTSEAISEPTSTSIAPIATSSAVAVESVAQTTSAIESAAPTSSVVAIESVAPTTTSSSVPSETSAADEEEDDDDDCYEE